MFKIFLLAIILLGNHVYSQTPIAVKVPGTKCSLIPPEGFVPATNFSGFLENISGSSIMVNEIPGPYEAIISGFTTEGLSSKGMTLVSRETIDLNGKEAMLAKVTQPANGTIYTKYVLIFGDAKLSVLVNGIFTEEFISLDEKIKASVLSTTYNPLQDDNPLEAASFIVDVSGTDFKLIKYMSGSLLYSTDGKIPTDKPTLIVANSIAEISIPDHKQFAIDRIRKLPGGEKTAVKEINEVKLDNMNGYEIIGENTTEDSVHELVYQVILFNNEGGYYIIVGEAKENASEYVETFRRIAKTFKRK